MIFEFKSRATGSVIMTRPIAEWILQIVGKTAGATGIITVEQMPDAIAALRKAIDEERQALRARAAEDREPGEDASADDRDTYPVSLAQRAFPFIEMLEAAHKAGKDITWGV